MTKGGEGKTSLKVFEHIILWIHIKLMFKLSCVILTLLFFIVYLL